MIDRLRRHLFSKLIISVGLVMLVSISTWAYFNINSQKERVMHNIVAGTDRLTTTIRLGTHYAMMLNSRDDINQIIQNIAKIPEIRNIRIYNKQGTIQYSNQVAEVGRTTNIKAEACYICHRVDPPLSDLELKQRTRIFNSPEGYRLLGIISPIRNEPGCATDCHVHPADKKILGALDVVVSLKATDKAIVRVESGIIGLAAFVFVLTSTIILLFVLRFVNRPIKKLIEGTRLIAGGDYTPRVAVDQNDEMGQLANAIHKMGLEISRHQKELNRQKDEYMDLFESVPCLITVQDRSYRLLRYNREFAQRFDPRPGDFCYDAYKGRSNKCRSCPVEKTFSDGKSHYAEETGIDKDGSATYWIVRSSPIVDEKGHIVAAMEISHDITRRRLLEVELEKSEKKYHAIFNNIPNPVFVLDMKTLEILDCNNSVTTVYGYTLKDISGRSFLDLFQEEEKDHYAFKMKTASTINRARQLTRDRRIIFVNIRLSPSEYSGNQVLLVTTSDITKRLETEQQLFQASKMATLGEMATGVAHELNQPLSVIKTASSFFIKKLDSGTVPAPDVLYPMLRKIDANIDRATNIIQHMRQFARKSDMTLEKVQLNDVLKSAFDIFSQQLKVHGIDVVWDINKALPRIKADPGRLEQVFINLLLNARDAVEEKAHQYSGSAADLKKCIHLKTDVEGNQVLAAVCDSGPGIPADMLEKVFEPYFTTKEVGKGTGLGLSISYGIVKDCGGDIRAVSNAGAGACFEMRFPIAAEEYDESR